VFSVGILEDKGGKGLFAYVKSGSRRSQGWFVTAAMDATLDALRPFAVDKGKGRDQG